jgi:hypothetical protein
MDREFFGDAHAFRVDFARKRRAKFLLSGSSSFAFDFVNQNNFKAIMPTTIPMTGLRTANQNEKSQPESLTGSNFVLII